MFASRRIRVSAVVLAVAVATCLLPPCAAWAADKVKVAASMAQQGLKAYESGDYIRAAQLYQEAYRTAPEKSEYLYAAARAEHVGGQFDDARTHYEAVLAEQSLSAVLRAKVGRYLDDVHAAKAKSIAADAEKAARTGNFRLAAQLYRDALVAAPQRVEWLFKAGVSEQLAGNLAAAERDLERYLVVAPQDAPDRGLASARLDGLRTPAGMLSAVPAPTVAPGARQTAPLTTKVEADSATGQTVTQSQQGTESRAAVWPTWAAIGGGVALIGAGVMLALAQSDERASLEAQLAQTDGGLISGTSYDSFELRRTMLNAAYRNAAIVGGVGIVALTTGGWWVWRTPRRVSVVPGPGTIGASLALQL